MLSSHTLTQPFYSVPLAVFQLYWLHVYSTCCHVMFIVSHVTRKWLNMCIMAGLTAAVTCYEQPSQSDKQPVLPKCIPASPLMVFVISLL